MNAHVTAHRSEREAPAKSAPAPLVERLLAARTVLIFGEITPQLAERACAQLLSLAAAGRAPIRVVLCSPGGHVESGDAIHDVIRFVEPAVTIVGTGWVASAGALIFVAVARERRLALPNTRFLLHEPSGGVSGAVTEIEIEARQVVAMRARLQRMFAEATGQPLEKLAREMKRNHWLSAPEAVNYGLAGRIVERVSKLGLPARPRRRASRVRSTARRPRGAPRRRRRA